MKDTVTIPKKDLIMLAEALEVANKYLNGNKEVRERKAPKLSAEQKRQNKYRRLLNGKK